MLCPSTMNPESSDVTARTSKGKLITSAITPPLWQNSWVKNIPLIGGYLTCMMNAPRYETTLEQNAELIASDLETLESPFSEKTVGVIDSK